jgi:GNAT superfamily N-acetyltransferase
MTGRQPARPAALCQLDGGYTAECASLLFHAYRNDPTFAYLFESERAGYDYRLRATLRELLRKHFAEQRPALGLLLDDRLIGVALIAPPQRRLELTESWGWRLRMLLGAGLRPTRRYLDYHAAVMACVPPGAHFLLPLLGIQPSFQGQHYGEQLLDALHAWCAQDEHAQGIVLDTAGHRSVEFLRRHGYQEIGEVAIGPVREQVLLRALPALEGLRK